LLVATLLVLHRLAGHTVFLHGRRYLSPDGSVVHRFFIQNGEPIPLRARMRISLSARDEQARIACVKRYCGPSPIAAALDSRGQQFQMVFHELPGFDTWVLEVIGNRWCNDVTLRLDELADDGTQRRRLVPLVRNDELDLRGAAVGDAGSPISPTVPFAFVVALALGALYGLAIATHCFGFFPRDSGFQDISRVWDPVAIVALGIGVVLLLRSARRPAPPLVQGFWTAVDTYPHGDEATSL
jgi:hypothetical protein